MECLGSIRGLARWRTARFLSRAWICRPRVKYGRGAAARMAKQGTRAAPRLLVWMEELRGLLRPPARPTASVFLLCVPYLSELQKPMGMVQCAEALPNGPPFSTRRLKGTQVNAFSVSRSINSGPPRAMLQPHVSMSRYFDHRVLHTAFAASCRYKHIWFISVV